eukprot:9103253-Alexandrium_andersonii.AAC.1
MAKDDRQEQLGGCPPLLQVAAATGVLPRAVSRDGEADGHAPLSGQRLGPPGTALLAAVPD